ncbi:MAG TPA: GNAT family N-acetyltransferase [Terriglobales bacterium]|nr:GNAT family N-acetyltransferase [Terriglobales bacterium]
MKVEVLPGFEALDEVRWNGLLGRARHPSIFLSWQWQTAWTRAFLDGRPLQLLRVADDAGTLVGLLPLYEENDGMRRLVGGVDVSDYLDLIAPAGVEEDVWQALLQYRAGEASEWDLHAIRGASPTLEILPRLCPAAGLRAEVETEERCPVLELPPSWDAYLEGLSGKDRHELRRKMRKLERELPGTSVRSHAGLDGWDGALAEFLRLHRLSKVGKARFMDERMQAFFQDATRALAAAGWARLWFLDWNGSAVASFLCLEYAGSVGLYNSGFDPAHAKLAPGIVLLAQVIRDAIERGVRVFDFLRGEEPYKYAFGPTPQDLFRVIVRP